MNTIQNAYQTANEAGNIDAVRQMNAEGMQPTFTPITRPSIISNYHDIATKHDIIGNSLRDLRSKNQLLTETEFAQRRNTLLPNGNTQWEEKSGRKAVQRILGANHLQEIIARHPTFTHAKVPFKVAVIRDNAAQNGPLRVEGYAAGTLNTNGNEFYAFDIDSNQVEGLYAEKITPVDRMLSRDEIDELVTVVAESRFGDFGTESNPNILVTANGFYFIDTEFKSFQGNPTWGDLWQRMRSFVVPADTPYFQQKIEEKSDKGNTSYRSLELELECLEDEPDDHPEKVALKEKIAALALVGGEKSRHLPNKFSFPISEILT